MVHERVRPSFDTMIKASRNQLEEDGFARDAMQISTSIDMRYSGQAFELTVPCTPEDDGEALRERFHAMYRRRYGFQRSDHPIETVTLRVAATGLVPQPRLALTQAADAGHKALPCRDLHCNGGWLTSCEVLRREHLPRDAHGEGPMVVEEFGATTVVPPGWAWRVDDFGNLRLSREKQPA